jgi:hypothetical protein
VIVLEEKAHSSLTRTIAHNEQAFKKRLFFMGAGRLLPYKEPGQNIKEYSN